MNTFHVTAALALLAASSPTRADDIKMDMPKSASSSAAGGGASKAFATSMTKMMANMNVKPTGSPDRDFVLMMMPHHQGAIDMARVELRYGRDPMLRTLATSIIQAQEAEIAEMKAWLAKTGE